MCTEYKGTIKIRRNGSAFVICDNEKKYDIKRGKTGTAFNDDVVVFSKNRKNENYVLKIEEKTKRRYRGKLNIRNNTCFFIADGNVLHKDVFIKKEETYGCEDGDLAIVEIDVWHPHEKNPRGHIIELIGDDTFDNQMLSILYENNIRQEFSSECISELDKITDEIRKKDLKGREDFRTYTTFTIDPEDAKDFDDALSVEYLDNGNCKIGIHIADVTHYIKKNCELDKEAYQRSFSTYLVDRVVPMLPEKLSNGICSLNPDEEKLTFSVVVEMNYNGKIVDKWIGRTIIKSDKRFTYAEAQERIENPKEELIYSKEINTLDRFAKIMRKQRIKDGSMEFHSKEPRFKFENEVPVDVVLKESQDSNKLIEEFMLLANKIVAKFITENEYDCCYRIHDKPIDTKLDELKKLAFYLGYDNLEGLGVDNSYQKLNSFIKFLETNKHRTIFEKMSIRSMSKAAYSTENVGHFGLGFEHYCHFTSPIRRYADVVIHRTLTKILYNKKRNKTTLDEDLCKHISLQEKTASTAERESIKVAQIHYLKNEVGKTYDAIVTRISDNGVFIDILDYDFRGMISYQNIKTSEYKVKDDYVAADDEGNEIRVGDELNVKIYNVDINNKLIDFVLE